MERDQFSTLGNFLHHSSVISRIRQAKVWVDHLNIKKIEKHPLQNCTIILEFIFKFKSKHR
jgi:hypothetical protein